MIIKTLEPLFYNDFFNINMSFFDQSGKIRCNNRSNYVKKVHLYVVFDIFIELIKCYPDIAGK